jgi:hypothetical protein
MITVISPTGPLPSADQGGLLATAEESPDLLTRLAARLTSGRSCRSVASRPSGTARAPGAAAAS